MTDCYLEPRTSCIVCPEVPAQPATPPRYEQAAEQGWGGARSIVALNGGVYLEFSSYRPVSAVICGLGSSSEYLVGDPASVQHGVLVTSNGPFVFWQLWENGQPIGVATEWVSTALLVCKIARLGDRVFYEITDGTTTWRGNFNASSSGELITLGCLYSTGDTIL